ncbi:n-alkane inducible cytochrome P- 450 [Scheffersomyces stipitis CBS 6054]|uniref:N-alkane inducible cytochrome P-450 n=1 Tax=Scheffersomyces stipitis (strain ATCC 58785 / CBS 6054 / NBRC 10063 / NRRL Y-11545) TaxID=322104 RepID=A3LS01_PICST|nr:n-alkane inducible cytochrome P- 450 [Scheffersomyces stipitis CBS 6054]ABN65477.2 n-alkane inducible cytochrome P- 450 [Scheffersomyces stipitis CBS 6054]KAG2733581.1 hypothetical protein G9P44_003106 [Scheffersomyces stipitis]
MANFIEFVTTNWYIIIPALLVLHKVFDLLYVQYLYRKLGAKPCTNQTDDHAFGIRAGFEMLKKKNEGTVVDFGAERFESRIDPKIPTFSMRLFLIPIVLTRDPENIKALLATQFNEFVLGSRFEQLAPLLGKGIFTLDGEGWKHSRAMLRPQFAKEQVAHVQSLEPHIQALAKHVRNAKGKSFDIQELFHRLTVDSATEFLFGQSVESLRDESVGMADEATDFAGKSTFAASFTIAQNWLANRAVAQKFYFLINPKEMRDSIKDVHRFVDYYVQVALDTPQDELDKKSKDGYIFLYELVKQTRDPYVLRSQLLNVLLAGRDTTAGLLSFAFFELARRPDIWSKLKDEIYENFGSGENSKVDEITFESLKRCEYLKAFLNETLRLYPSVPVNFRVATKDTTLPRGGGKDGSEPILVRKGQSVFYSVYATHRSEAYYGKDRHVFRPERWFEPSARKLGWAYLPFNGGPRICLGQQFALTEASYVVARLIQLFPNIENYEPEEVYPPFKNSQLTMNLLNGLHIGLY